MQAVKNQQAVSIKGAYARAGSDAKSLAKGCVMYYGMPEKDVDRLKTLTAM